MARITLADDWKGFSGRIGDAVIYSWRGLECMRCHVVPGNPDTPAQRQRRRLFAEAVNAWQSLPPNVRTRWNRLSSGGRTTGFNLFVSAYLQCRSIPILHVPRVHMDRSIPASSLIHTRSACCRRKETGTVYALLRPPERKEPALAG